MSSFNTEMQVQRVVGSVSRLYREVGMAPITIESTQFDIRTCRKHTCRGSFILLGSIAIESGDTEQEVLGIQWK